MAATAAESSAPQNAAATDSQQGSTVDSLANALASVEIQEDKSSEEKVEQPPRELHVYTHPQLLFLSKSPLVKAPDGMPPLKDWFGDWSEQQSGNKKEAEASNGATNGRERRFRRDAEDGDAPTRPSFRSSLSQPSQMGNFRHQSLRTADRERDRDSERERQRDERDRENQERLRNLSDKYDRERLALSSSASALRGKERESAPHLASTTTRNGQAQSTTSTRRADGREPAKKKPGETSDDWRRGAEPPARGSRDERPETTRRDRDRRETSRTRRDPSTSRRDRDRDRSRRRDERDEPRRDKDDYFRRDLDDRDDGYRDRDRYDYGRSQRDLDRDLDEDPRRWRDDGKRDERVAARKERERTDRDRERGWDRWEPSHDRDRERLDDRDTRSKRTRDRRSGAGLDETKDKEERKEREKEKEPAWMETYVPTTPSGGILGARSADGELDGIQAWKKGLKEKEKKEKEGEQAVDATSKSTSTTTEPAPSHAPPAAEGSLDEIQLFKLMMKREAAKKDSDPSPTLPLPGSSSTGRQSPARLKDVSAPILGASSSAASPAPLSTEASAISNAPPSASSEGSKILSFLSQTSTDAASSQASKLPSSNIPAADNFPPAVSRMFPTPPGLSPAISQNSERPTIDLSTPSYPNSPFDPPAGSRLLAFASRTAPGASQIPPKTLPPSDVGNAPFNPLTPSALPGGPGQRLTGLNPPHGMSGGAGMQQTHEMMMFDTPIEPHMVPNARATPSERSARSFSPFGQAHQPPFGLHDAPEGMRLPQADAMRRVSGPHERSLGLGPDHSPGFVDLGGAPGGFNPGSYELVGNAIGPGASAAKGSRFAKFFDAKNREPQMNAGRKASGAGFVSTSPLPGQGRDHMAMNGIPNTPGESRAMEDLFAMLQNSTQGNHHRASPGLNQTGRLSAAGGPFGQAPIDLQVLQQQQQHLLHQQHQHQQLAQQNARLDSLYDSRMDDRNFVPDGMVPGLRLAPRPRSREPSVMHFNEHLDEPLQVNPRLAQQQRTLEQLYGGAPAPGAFAQHGGLGRNVPALQQNQFRANPPLVPAQSVPQGAQRLPPGLANLGGRPPHDASQFLGAPLGGLAPPHGGPHMSQQQQQQQSLSNYGALGGFNGPVPGRGGPIGGPHHNAPLAVNPLGGMGPGSALDLRAQHAQPQLLNLGAGGNGMGGGLRGAGFNGQPSSAHLQHLARQQQQQQQLQQLGMPPAHMLPPHLQPPPPQQNLHTNSQGAQDLMALLMGGQRE